MTAADTPHHDHSTGRSGLGRDPARWLGLVRLGLGLGWGVVLWWLYQAADGPTWPATRPMLFGPLLLVCAYVPFVKLAGVGRLRWRTYAVWAVAAAIVLALVGWHDVARQTAETLRRPPYLSPPMLAFVAAALFIAHHLVAPADAERRWIATYPAYFDTAWKAGVQLALSLGFAGAFWLLLHLGAALFRIIGIRQFGDLLGEDWFWIPVSSVVFALAVHLTDVRDGLIRGVRTVVLMLLSWLLLVMTVLVGGFLLALPFTGLDGLWSTGSATALVLAAAGALIVLINTAYQDGRPDNLPPMVLRAGARIASVLLTPLILIAVWGLVLRVGQHGLTPDRIIAAACALVGAAYAAGYGFAALAPFVRPSPWMKPLEPANIGVAALSVLVILALFSPLADPARLSVADQVGRLERGAVTPGQFDYAFLRFESGRAGEAALARLTRSTHAEIARRAREAQTATSSYALRDKDRETPFKPVIDAWPAGRTLPPAFLASVPESDPRRGCSRENACVAIQRDLDGDGVAEILMARSHEVVLFALGSDGAWTARGDYLSRACPGEIETDARELLKGSRLNPAPARWPDLESGGRRAHLDPTMACASVNP